MKIFENRSHTLWTIHKLYISKITVVLTFHSSDSVRAKYSWKIFLSWSDESSDPNDQNFHRFAFLLRFFGLIRFIIYTHLTWVSFHRERTIHMLPKSPSNPRPTFIFTYTRPPKNLTWPQTKERIGTCNSQICDLDSVLSSGQDNATI